MTFRSFLLIMIAATAAVWGGWVYVLLTIDPTTAGLAAFVFFYLTLGVALVGTFTILGTAVRRLFRRDELVSRHVMVSFRQAFLFSVLMVSSLILLARGMLTWWLVSLIILTLTMLELAFLSSHRPRYHRP